MTSPLTFPLTKPTTSSLTKSLGTIMGQAGAATVIAQARQILMIGTSLTDGYGSTSYAPGALVNSRPGLLNSAGGYIVVNYGLAGASSIQIADHVVAGTLDPFKLWTMIIEVGRNNAVLNQCVADINRIIAWAGHRRFVVVPILPHAGTAETDGTGGTTPQSARGNIDAINNAFKANWPNNNCVDAMIAAMCTDPGHVPPPSIMSDPTLVADQTHPGNSGYVIWEGVDKAALDALDLLIPFTAKTTPDPFSFTAVVSATGGSVVSANLVNTTTTAAGRVTDDGGATKWLAVPGNSGNRISGINGSTPISVVGGEYQINSGSWVSTSGTVVNGDKIAVRVTASASAFTETHCALTIGGVSATFSVTTGGVQLIQNGDFHVDADPLWNIHVNAATAGGTGNLNGSFPSLGQSIPYTAGKSYTVTFTISALTSGGVTAILFGGTNRNGTTRSTLGTFTETLVANTGNTSLRFNGSTSSTVLSIDNVSCVQAAP